MTVFLRIMSIFFLLNINTNSLAVEVVDKIKDKSKTVFKTLTRKSLTKDEILKFLTIYVIIIDDKKGDGVVTYYFEDNTYKRYKKLKITRNISRCVWIHTIYFEINALKESDIQSGDFTGLAQEYSQNRPDYSESVLRCILGLIDKPIKEIDFVDVGAGTGIWTRMFHASGLRQCIAVEPNIDILNCDISDSSHLAINWVASSVEATGVTYKYSRMAVYDVNFPLV